MKLYIVQRTPIDPEIKAMWDEYSRTCMSKKEGKAGKIARAARPKQKMVHDAVITNRRPTSGRVRRWQPRSRR